MSLSEAKSAPENGATATGKRKEPDSAPVEDKSPHSGVPEYLTCRICYYIYCDPVILKCGHSLCSDCLESCTKCPYCRGCCYPAVKELALRDLIESKYKEELKAALHEKTRGWTISGTFPLSLSRRKMQFLSHLPDPSSREVTGAQHTQIWQSFIEEFDIMMVVFSYGYEPIYHPHVERNATERTYYQPLVMQRDGTKMWMWVMDRDESEDEEEDDDDDDVEEPYRAGDQLPLEAAAAPSAAEPSS